MPDAKPLSASELAKAALGNERMILARMNYYYAELDAVKEASDE